MRQLHYSRSKIAFGGGTSEEFEKAKTEIPMWAGEKLAAEISKLADELAVQVSRTVTAGEMTEF